MKYRLLGVGEVVQEWDEVCVPVGTPRSFVWQRCDDSVGRGVYPGDYPYRRPMEEPPEKTYRLLRKGEALHTGDESFLGGNRWEPVALSETTESFYNPDKNNPIRRQIGLTGRDIVSHDYTVVLTLYRVCGDDRMEVCIGSPPLGKTIVDTRQIKVTFEEHR